ncbi:MAG: PEP-utilizing enzyme [Rubrivivax sp.]
MAQGILTARGGMTSHAAVVAARGMGKCCVSGSARYVDPKARAMTIGERRFAEATGCR